MKNVRDKQGKKNLCERRSRTLLITNRLPKFNVGCYYVQNLGRHYTLNSLFIIFLRENKSILILGFSFVLINIRNIDCLL